MKMQSKVESMLFSRVFTASFHPQSIHQTANSPFVLPHITYKKIWEEFRNLLTEFILSDHIFLFS